MRRINKEMNTTRMWSLIPFQRPWDNYANNRRIGSETMRNGNWWHKGPLMPINQSHGISTPQEGRVHPSTCIQQSGGWQWVEYQWMVNRNIKERGKNRGILHASETDSPTDRCSQIRRVHSIPERTTFSENSYWMATSVVRQSSAVRGHCLA